MNRFSSIAGLALALALGVGSERGSAADHADAPSSTLDPNADITDVFIFRNPKDSTKLIGAIAFGGTPRPNPRVDGATGRYDKDVVFTYYIDNDLDGTADIRIYTRYGQNSKGEWGVEVENVPGAGSTYIFGPVEKVNVSSRGLRMFSGLADDPFFFDFEGFTATIRSQTDTGTGSFAFNNARDSFRERNLTTIVFEMDAALASGGRNQLNVWATTARRMP